MVWFKVDDRFHSHPKAAAASLAALGLWAVAGSWSGDHLRDGFVPDHMIPLLSRGQSELAKELCDAGLWRRTRGGYLFHEWHSDGDGTKRNPSKAEVDEKRRKKADAGRKGGLASGKARSRRASKTEARASPTVQPPTRPSPPSEGRGEAPGLEAEERHAFTPDANGTCSFLACGLPKSNRRHRSAS